MTAERNETNLGESLTRLVQVARGELGLLTQPGRLLLAELELKVDDVLLASEVADHFAELL